MRNTHDFLPSRSMYYSKRHAFETCASMRRQENHTQMAPYSVLNKAYSSVHKNRMDIWPLSTRFALETNHTRSAHSYSEALDSLSNPPHRRTFNLPWTTFPPSTGSPRRVGGHRSGHIHCPCRLPLPLIARELHLQQITLFMSTLEPSSALRVADLLRIGVSAHSIDHNTVLPRRRRQYIEGPTRVCRRHSL